MTNKQDDNYYGVLVEEMRENFRILSEGISDIKRQVRVLPELQQTSRLHTEKLEVIEAAIKDLSKDVRGIDGRVAQLDTRVTRLEAA